MKDGIVNEIELSNAVLPVWVGGGHLTAPEDFLHADRNIPFHVLIYVVKGCIYVTEEGSEYAVGPGELLFLKAGLHHFGERPIRRGTEWYYVHFFLEQEGAWRNETAMYDDRNAWDQRFAYFAALPKYIRGLAGTDTERRLAELVDYANSRNSDKYWYAGERLFRLLSHIALRKSAGGERLSDIVAGYLSEHYREKLNYRELAGRFYVSYQRLATLFSEDRGMSMGEYVKGLRLDEAAGLLRSTLKSVGEIAAAVGYQDALYFSKVFSKCYGVSPREYRLLPREY